MDRETIAAKLRKILALHEGASTPEEAATALAMAQAMAERHNIELASLGTDESQQEKAEKGRIVEPTHRLPTWLTMLAKAVADNNGCFVLIMGTSGRGSTRYVEIAGRPSDIATCKTLYAWARVEVDRLTARNAHGRGRTYSNSYRNGCVEGFRRAMADERRRLQEEMRGTVSETALTVVDDRAVAARALYGKLRGGRRSSVRDTGAYGAGTEAGARMHGGTRAKVTQGTLRLT